MGNLILDREITKANLQGQEYLELNIQALDPDNDREPDRISTELLITPAFPRTKEQRPGRIFIE